MPIFASAAGAGQNALRVKARAELAAVRVALTERYARSGSAISRRCRCASSGGSHGNPNCRNGGADNTGKVDSGTVSGNVIRFSVMVPADVSHCYYNGRLTSSSTIHGAYACYQGGGLLEQGVFDLTKSSSG